ncbi:MAG TPA: amidohydrolase family protein [Acidimicrobiales bacterium]|nr:amidohydrolase family protein [Acidimicrobiales bacterium]HJM97629.1 amidohydrolase family protein [Acidimicrobiales bacterium]
MSKLDGIPIIDTMIGFKDANSTHYVPPSVREQDKGEEHVADYMFKDVPQADQDEDAIERTINAMNKNGVAIGLVTLMGTRAPTAAKIHPDKFLLCSPVDPNDVMGAVTKIKEDHATHGIRAVSFFPAGCDPHVPIDDAKTYPIYATCVELDLPIFINAGVPGPRVIGDSQNVSRFDQVCYDFPNLKIVMRHGAEPDEALAVKLMLKWPNLHYSTSAFAPMHYPKTIIDYANTRGTDKIIYGGYFPFGLELDRIIEELESLPLRDHVWKPFLQDNAARLLKVGIDTV